MHFNLIIGTFLKVTGQSFFKHMLANVFQFPSMVAFCIVNKSDDVRECTY